MYKFNINIGKFSQHRLVQPSGYSISRKVKCLLKNILSKLNYKKTFFQQCLVCIERFTYIDNQNRTLLCDLATLRENFLLL